MPRLGRAPRIVASQPQRTGARDCLWSPYLAPHRYGAHSLNRNLASEAPTRGQRAPAGDLSLGLTPAKLKTRATSACSREHRGAKGVKSWLGERKMTKRRLAIFVTTAGHTVAINPDLVQCLYGSPKVPVGAVQICFGTKAQRQSTGISVTSRTISDSRLQMMAEALGRKG